MKCPYTTTKRIITYIRNVLSVPSEDYGGLPPCPFIKAELDNRKLRCFLETQEERNIAYYQRFGFEIAKETIIPGLDLQNWVMIREPKK